MKNEEIQKLIENLSDDELDIMYHTLGYDGGSGNRNCFYTSENTNDGKIIKNLIEKDCMYLMLKSPWKSDANYYGCTAKGKNIVAEVRRRKKKAEKINRKLKKAQENLIKLKNAEDKLLMEIRKICAFEIDCVLYQDADGFVAVVENGNPAPENFSVLDIINLHIKTQRKITIENLLGLPF